MVSTRRHPGTFPPPNLSPSKAVATRSSRSSSTPWKHRPSNLTLIWLIVSLPLVLWDTGYVVLRPHSMPGGRVHSPIWTPYDLYGTVDHNYGWKAYNSHSGFTAAQTALNVIESVMYVWYLSIIYFDGHQSARRGRGAPKPAVAGWLGEARSVGGSRAGEATLLGFSAAVMTFSKTLLYCGSHLIRSIPDAYNRSYLRQG